MIYFISDEAEVMQETKLRRKNVVLGPMHALPLGGSSCLTLLV